jgi:hypothetical protein
MREETPESWIIRNLHVPTWFDLPNDHFIEPYKIWWSCFEWFDLVVPIFWWSMPCMSSPAREEYYLQSPHPSEASNIFWVAKHGTHCELSTSLKATPLNRTVAHTFQWWCTDQWSKKLAFHDANATYTFHRGDSEVYVITNFKLQGMMSPVGVTLLKRLGYQYIGTNLLHLLFYLCHNVRAKDDCFTWLRPTQQCLVGSPIEWFERWHLNALLITAVIGELCQWGMLVPLRAIIQDVGAKLVFNDLIHLLSLTVSLRMIRWASD